MLWRLAAVGLIGIAPGLVHASLNESRPNILYLFTDDHSARTLGCYAELADAYRWASTPNLDRLAGEGVRFTACYTGAKCVPSRGTALTGRLQSGYTRETPYWTSKLREHGYYTGMVGKWHWNVPRHGDAWDWSVVWPHHEGNTGEGDDSDYYFNQKVRIHGGELTALGGYSTDRYTDYTVAFLQERSSQPDQPWFFWVCFAGVHGPYTPADRHLERYRDGPPTDIPADVFGPRPGKPDHAVWFSRWSEDADGRPLRNGRSLDSWVKQYNQAVCALDEGVGRILQALRDTGQLENTVVLFTADQGFAWGQHGYRDKLAPYDANLLAPLIVRYPKRFPKGAVCREPVNGMDIIATIHRLTGLESVSTDGRDLTPLLHNPTRSEWSPEPMIQMFSGGLYGSDAIAAALRQARSTGDWSRLIAERATGIPAWLMLREGRHKYVRYLQQDYLEELYDLEADPYELMNLAVSREYHPILEALRAKLIAAFAKRGASFLDLLPPPRVLASPPVTSD